MTTSAFTAVWLLLASLAGAELRGQSLAASSLLAESGASPIAVDKLGAMDKWGKPLKHDNMIANAGRPGRGVFIFLTFAFSAFPVFLWLCGVSKTICVFCLYVGLYVAWALVAFATRGAVESSAMIVLNALVVKLVVSLILWRAWEGDSYLQLPMIIWKERSILNLYVVPAGLYAIGDMLSVDALQATDPSTFAILFNSRMLFLIFVWQYLLGRKLEAIHWISLMAILAGCVAKEIPSAEADTTKSRYWAYGVILVLGMISSTAAVWNEMLLQKRPSAGVSLQNLAMYSWGMFWMFIVALGTAFLKPGAVSPLTLSAWTNVWSEPLVALLVLIFAFHGITAAYFLRYLSSIAREVALAVYTLVSISFDCYLFGETLVAVEYAGIALVMVGIALFAYKPVVAKAVQEGKSAQSPTEASPLLAGEKKSSA